MAEYSVSRTGNDTAALAVPYTVSTLGVSPTVLASGTVTIPAGSLSTTLDLAQPQQMSAHQSAKVAIGSGPGEYVLASGASSAIITAVNNSTFMESVFTTTPVLQDAGGAAGSFTVVLSQAPGTGGYASVQFTLGGTAQYGTDYTIAAADGGDCSVSTANGQTVVTLTVYGTSATRTVTIVPTGSGTAPGETITAAPSGGEEWGATSNMSCIAPDASEGTLTIADDLPDVTASDAEAEPGSDETFTVSLSQAMNYDVVVSYSTLDGSAIAGTDYVAESGTLTFPANTTQLTETITVPTMFNLGDTSRSFSLSLTAGSGSPVTVDGSIGTLLPVSAQLRLYNNGQMMVHAADLSPGGLVMFGTLGTLKNAVPMLIDVNGAASFSSGLQLTYSSKLRIYEQDGTLIGPGTVLPFAVTTVYVTGVGTSASIGDADVYLNYVASGSNSVRLDHAVYTVALVQLNSITFTNNYRVNGLNGVNVASTFSSDGTPRAQHRLVQPRRRARHAQVAYYYEHYG